MYAIRSYYDRLVWLNSARLILQSEKFANYISPKAASSLAMYESEREYWSHRFYNLLDYTGSRSFSMDKDYFAKASNIPGDEIEERSIKVIYEIALSFDEDKDPINNVSDVITSYSIHYTKLYESFDEDKDPINNVSEFSRDELKKFHVSQCGLKAYLEEKIRITSYNVCYTKLLRLSPD